MIPDLMEPWLKGRPGELDLEINSDSVALLVDHEDFRSASQCCRLSRWAVDRLLEYAFPFVKVASDSALRAVVRGRLAEKVNPDAAIMRDTTVKREDVHAWTHGGGRCGYGRAGGGSGSREFGGWSGDVSGGDDPTVSAAAGDGI